MNNSGTTTTVPSSDLAGRVLGITETVPVSPVVSALTPGLGAGDPWLIACQGKLSSDGLQLFLSMFESGILTDSDTDFGYWIEPSLTYNVCYRP